MAHMQDKDFDQLFKDKLENAEVEAPVMMWDKIEKGIAPGPKKRIIPIYWMAAALAVVAVGATLVFHNDEKIQLHNGGLVLENSQGNVDKSSEVIDNQDVEMLETPVITLSGDVNNSVDNLKPRKKLIAMQPSSGDQHLPQYKDQEEVHEIENDMPLGSENEGLLVAESDAFVGNVEAPGEMQQALAAEGVQEERKAIRNVGDLVNFVVDKVDKREEKLIQFNTDEDGNSSLVSINIGILKFNKKQRDKR